MERLKTYMQNKGIRKKDIPTAFLVLKLESLATFVGLTTLFYVKSPAAYASKTTFFKRLRQSKKIGRFVSFVEHKTIKFTSNIKHYPVLKWFPKRVVLAMTESYFLYKFLYFFILPIQIHFLFLFFKKKEKRKNK